jgi:hypothetical protein
MRLLTIRDGAVVAQRDVPQFYGLGYRDVDDSLWVKELRATAGEETDLPVAVAVEGQQLNLAHPTQFRTSVEGARRDLHPIVCEEIFLVAREALGNALPAFGCAAY